MIETLDVARVLHHSGHGHRVGKVRGRVPVTFLQRSCPQYLLGTPAVETHPLSVMSLSVGPPQALDFAFVCDSAREGSKQRRGGVVKYDGLFPSCEVRIVS